MAVKLNRAEKQWISDLQAVLDACPSKRLGFYTIGDPQVTIYDRSKEKAINALMDSHLSSLDFGAAVEKAKASTDAVLDFPAHVHSVAG
jgi:hypothetical protein